MRRLLLIPVLTILLTSPCFAESPTLDAAAFSGLELRAIGPALMSGRIADLAVHPDDRSTWYVAAGSGGVWKTTNAGTSWTPIFDGQGSYSIGCLTLDPQAPDTIWVGTGENVSGRHVGFGDGLYRSRDGGTTWEKRGLEASEHLAKIIVHPEDSNTLWVAAEGPLWSAGGERGVYKTTDGGETWKRVLHVDDDTGATDLEIDPENPDVLYAATYQRRRSVWAFLAGGPGSGIWKSVDGGETWREVTRGLPTASGDTTGDVGKIALAISPVDPRVVYATVEAHRAKRGFFRSQDRGESWEKRSSYISGGTGGHYYQEIYASPHDVDEVYQMDVWMHWTQDGGASFHRVGHDAKHSDNHALAFDPTDPDYLLAGTDGGLYESFDHGKTWKFVTNLPLTQLYKMALDNDAPFFNVYGGTQDNNAQLGPSRTVNTHGIRSSDWINTVSGDGYGGQIDPTDPNIIYSEWQYGGLTRFDKRTGELLDIKPQPGPEDPPERWNWDSPILISPHDSNRLYFGSQRVWRSDDRGSSWSPVSGDLTRDENRYTLAMAGRVWSVDALWDNRAMSWYNSTTSISESALVEGLLYVGTDDGLFQVSEDGGSNWRRGVLPPAVPERSFVNDVRASPHDADTVYAALDNHKAGDFSPYLLRSRDRGRSWASIAGDLPKRHLVWAMVEDPQVPDLLFAATEFGLFFSLPPERLGSSEGDGDSGSDGGSESSRSWIRLMGGVPTIAFRDLEVHPRDGDLVGATFGRGFYVLDDMTPIRQASASTLAADATLFPVRRTWLYMESTPLGLPGQANRGSDYFTAPNPPFGALVTYHLSEALETPRNARRAEEKEIRKAGGDARFPGWDTLREEELARQARVVLTVRDADGNAVRRIEGPTSAGFHRVAWDLRYPAPDPSRLEPLVLWNPWMRRPVGPIAPPGRYTVELAKEVGGELVALAEPQSFEVAALHDTGVDWAADSAFQHRTADLLRRALGANEALNSAMERLRYLDRALLDTPGGAELRAEADALRRRIAEIDLRLSGDTTREGLSEASLPSVIERLFWVLGHWGTTQGPTTTHRQSFTVAERQFADLREELAQAIDVELQQLETQAAEAGAPWTPGRRVP